MLEHQLKHNQVRIVDDERLVNVPVECLNRPLVPKRLQRHSVKVVDQVDRLRTHYPRINYEQNIQLKLKLTVNIE